MVIRCVHHSDWYVYAYYAQWRTVAVTPFCRTLTSGGAAAVDEKVRVDEEEKTPPALLPAPLGGLPALLPPSKQR